MSKVVIISGKQGAGKTTLSIALKAALEAKGKTVVPLKFADVLYDLHNYIRDALEGYGIQRPKKDGFLLQWLGTEYGREKIDQQIWVKIAQNRVKALAEGTVVLIDDCRFTNEFDAFPHALSIRLECPEEIRKGRAEGWRELTNHPSETGLDALAEDGEFDCYYDTSVEETRVIVASIVKKIIPDDPKTPVDATVSYNTEEDECA